MTKSAKFSSSINVSVSEDGLVSIEQKVFGSDRVERVVLTKSDMEGLTKALRTNDKTRRV